MNESHGGSHVHVHSDAHDSAAGGDIRRRCITRDVDRDQVVPPPEFEIKQLRHENCRDCDTVERRAYDRRRTDVSMAVFASFIVGLFLGALVSFSLMRPG